jgi:hypothetical protein
MRLAFIAAEKAVHSVTILCRCLRVTRSGFYAWLRRGLSARAQRYRVLRTKLRAFHTASGQVYGRPRLWRDLHEDGEAVSEKRVKRLMREEQIQGKVPKRFKQTTNSHDDDPIAANVLDRDFTAAAPNQRWVGDTPQPKGVSGPMRCQLMALCGGDQPIESWTDVDGHPLETRLADIAVAIVGHGERVCRSSAEHYREWVIKRKAEIVEEERRKEAERRRLERERLERLEKARIGRLLAQAKALREAQEIRAYVSAVRDRQATLDDPLTEAGFQDWADWALSQADRIDPVLSGSFRTVQVDD